MGVWSGKSKDRSERRMHTSVMRGTLVLSHVLWQRWDVKIKAEHDWNFPGS